jgi:hypothetical protein
MGYTLKKKTKRITLCVFKFSFGWRIHTNIREILFPRTTPQELRFIIQSRPQVTIKWAIAYYGLISLGVKDIKIGSAKK